MPFEFDFIGAGGLAYDLVLRVDRLPLADQKYPAEIIGKLPGGFIANATCAAARLGLHTGYIGWIGDDREGMMLHDDFEWWQVITAGLVTITDAITPFTVVTIDRQGKRMILLPSFPLYRTELTYEQATLAKQAHILYTFPRDLAWCKQLRHATMESGGLLVLDIESAVPMRGDELHSVIAMADIVFFTQDSLKQLKLPAIHKLVKARQWIIMTAGARGAYGAEPGRRKSVFQPALDVAVTDTTGAGDCFHAALLAAKLDGATLSEALAFANAAAAIKIQHKSARGGLPTRAEVEILLKRRSR